MTYKVLKSCKSKTGVIFTCNNKNKIPPGYHHHGFVVTHALFVNRISCAQVYELLQNRCGDEWDGTLFYD